MACMPALAFIANFCLTGVKRLEPFFPEFIQQADRWNVGITLTTGGMFLLRKKRWGTNVANSSLVNGRSLRMTFALRKPEYNLCILILPNPVSGVTPLSGVAGRGASCAVTLRPGRGTRRNHKGTTASRMRKRMTERNECERVRMEAQANPCGVDAPA
jgi:hypothetical protein